MKNKNVFLLVLITTLGALLSSCGGDDPEVDYARDKIINNKEESRWVLNRLSVNGVDGLLESYIDTCSRDDVLIFKNDDTYEVQEGAIKCDTSMVGNTIRVGLWEVSEQQDTLYFLPTDNSRALRARIVDVESTRIIYSVYDDSNNLIEYTYLLE